MLVALLLLLQHPKLLVVHRLLVAHLMAGGVDMARDKVEWVPVSATTGLS